MSPVAVADAREKGTLRIDYPDAFVPLLEPARYKGAWGGRGSSKSHSFASLLIDQSMDASNPMRAVCIREVQKSLEQSVKRLIEDKIKTFGLGHKFRITNTHIETPGDGIIIFQGMQNHTSESIKSLEGYRVAWVEEAQSLSERSLTLLRPTIRKETCRHCYKDKSLKHETCLPGHTHFFDPSEMWFSWNPRHKTDPIDQFLRVDPPPSAIVVPMSYRDNPWFPDVLQKEMEWDRGRDPDKYEHVWLGGYEKHTNARVFRNWRVEEFDTPRGTLFLFGGDWGFATDPTVLVRCWLDGRKLYIDWEAYAIGCEIDDTPDLFDSVGCRQQHLHGKPGSQCTGMARQWRIVADSARPETISYLKRHGYPQIMPAKKGAGSVEEGVKFLQNYDIIIHPRCVHTIDEFTSYSYVMHPLTGDITPILQDKKNHVIDSVRYAVESALKHKVINAAPTEVGPAPSQWHVQSMHDGEEVSVD